MPNRFTNLRRGLALAVLFATGSLAAQAQGVGIGTTAPDASAALDIVSSTKGALLPRLTSTQRGAIVSPATGLLVFQTDAPMGFYYNTSITTTPQWQLLNPAGDNLGNHTATQALNLSTYALTGTGADLGTTKGVGIRADGGLNIGQNTLGNNIYLGYQAGQSNAGNFNQFSGYQAGKSNTGSNNLFSGYQSGLGNTTGSSNLFSGSFSGFANTTGSDNLFRGNTSGFRNTTGNNNLFSGSYSGQNNTTGSDNLFSGGNSGQNNTTGSDNLFSGSYGGFSNTTGINNLFSGSFSGFSNTTGNNNLFSGYQSGKNNTTGSNNQFSGFQSGYSNTAGSNNLFSGYQSGYSNTTGSNNPSPSPFPSPNTTGSDNLFSGYQSGYSNTTGSKNLFSGSSSGFSNTTGSNNLFSGNYSGFSNTTGSYNQFSGSGSGQSNTTGSNNLFSGSGSGQSNTTGSNNLFSGIGSGVNNTTGSQNLFSGRGSGFFNNTGSQNLFSGYQSGFSNTAGSNNLFSGYNSGLANTTGSNNTAVGSNANFGAAALTNATAIGANAVVSQSNSLVLGGTGANAVSVGIGTTAPTQPLEVAGQIFSNVGGFRFPDNTVQTTAATGGTGSGTTVAAGNGLSATTAAGVTTVNLGGSLTGATTITQAGNVFSLTGGNVGIGTTTPFQKLDVSGALSSTTAGTSPLLRLSRPDNINVKYANALEISLGSYGTTGQAQSQVDFNLSNGNTDNPDMTALTLRGDGNVGIGTTTPTQSLDVNGGIVARAYGVVNNQGAYLQWNRSGGEGETWLINHLGGGTANAGIRFAGVTTNGSTTVTEWARIDNSGNMAINSTSANGYRLYVNGTVSGGVYTTTSDRRLKTDIRPLTGALALVQALHGHRYRWNPQGVALGGTAQREQVGVIAQELETVLPELVSTGTNGIKTVNYAQLTPVLIEAMKEQQLQIETLKAQNAALQARTALVEADHASLLSLQAQLARLLGEGAQARK